MSDQIIGEITKWLFSLVVTGGAGGIAAWFLFKKWLEGRFAKDLEDFKATKVQELEALKNEYTKDTERLKSEINRFADRASRFQTREYEVLPEAWGLMNKACSSVSNSIMPFMPNPNIENMEEEQFEEWLTHTGFSEFEKNKLRSSKSKTELYYSFKTWKFIVDAESEIINFQNYVILNGVFFEENLYNKLLDVSMMMRQAITAKRMYESMKGFRLSVSESERAIEINEKVEAVRDEVLIEVRKRLADIKFGT